MFSVNLQIIYVLQVVTLIIWLQIVTSNTKIWENFYNYFEK